MAVPSSQINRSLHLLLVSIVDSVNVVDMSVARSDLGGPEILQEFRAKQLEDSAHPTRNTTSFRVVRTVSVSLYHNLDDHC
jgi:hypothetical protein